MEGSITDSAFDLMNIQDLYNGQFEITQLGKSVDESSQNSSSILDSVKNACIKALQKDGDEESKFIVDLDQDLKEALKKGEVNFVKGKNGEIYAQLRESNGHFGKKLSIKEELQEENISVEALQMAIQMQAIAAQLGHIIDKLATIEENVHTIQEGQQNDRIAYFYSGLSTYIEAQSVTDKYLRKQLVAQAIRAMNDANAQLVQEAKGSVRYLMTDQYKRTKKPIEKIEERLSTIQACTGIIQKIAFMKAAMFWNEGEWRASVSAIDEYGQFIEKLIVPNAGKLSELDKNDKLIDKGTWGTIANTLIGCQDIKQRLQAPQYNILTEEAS